MRAPEKARFVMTKGWKFRYSTSMEWDVVNKYNEGIMNADTSPRRVRTVLQRLRKNKTTKRNRLEINRILESLDDDL